MPVCHFTFHTYGSWLPDRPEGYHIHGQGYRSADPVKANAYRQRMQEPETHLQRDALEHVQVVLLDSQYPQRFELYAMACESTHLHVVAAWWDVRTLARMQRQIKASLTRALIVKFGRRKWFSAKAGKTPVVDEAHLDELIHRYLPKHELYWMRGATDGNE